MLIPRNHGTGKLRHSGLCACVSLAEQGLKVQLQASDGGVQGVELTARLPGSSCSVRAHRPQLGLKVSVEVVAALHLTETASQRVVEGLGYRGDGSVQQGRRRRGRGGACCEHSLTCLLYPLRRQEEGQATETFRALSHPQLEEHLQDDENNNCYRKLYYNQWFIQFRCWFLNVFSPPGSIHHSAHYLHGRQAVVIGQLLSLLVAQVLDAQAEPQLLQRHRRHIVGHVIDLRVQREGGGGVKDASYRMTSRFRDS